MSFTAHKLSNLQFLGLKGEFYVVVNPDVRGEFVDLVDAQQVADLKGNAETLAAGFQRAADHMPFERTENNSFRIDYTHNSGVSAIHIPKSENDDKFHQSYREWLCWRARVDLWLNRDALKLTEGQKQQVLRLLDQQQFEQDKPVAAARQAAPALAAMS